MAYRDVTAVDPPDRTDKSVSGVQVCYQLQPGVSLRGDREVIRWRGGRRGWEAGEAAYPFQNDWKSPGAYSGQGAGIFSRS